MPARFVATYRLQLQESFPLDAAAGIADYLAALGMSHAYCSPLLQCVAGSPHGYDVVDPSRIDSSRGGEEGYARFCAALGNHRLGQVLDIVPNHMAAASPQNRWWWDVLRHGRRSRHARFFDIDWEPETAGTAGPVLVPILGRPLAEAVAAGEVTVGEHEGAPAIAYFDHLFPLALDDAGEEHGAALAAGEPLAPERLLALLDRQPYRLAHWRRARGELNYRRFFDISDLVGLRQEDPEVFAATHDRVLALVREGSVDGLRIDHPDGLRDPAGYLERLAGASGGAWVVVEKILEPGEPLRPDWPVAGTTGYEVAAMALGLFVDPAGEAGIDALWRELVPAAGDWEGETRACRLRIMDRVLPAEIERLDALFLDYLGGEAELPPAAGEASAVLRETLAAFPVYRTYVRARDRRVSAADEAAVREAIGRARRRRGDLPAMLFCLLEDALLLHRPRGAELAERFQQTSGPVMAKGVEDTALYTWTRFVALNEVGDSPGRFGVSPAALHRFAAERARRWPESLIAVSTHDSKRSADVRARLVLLAEMPEEWAAAVRRWRDTNRRHRSGDWPDPAAELLIYQTLVGAWPLPLERLQAYLEKAAREAKRFTSWTAPDAAYEEALRIFAAGALGDPSFRRDLERFVTPLVAPGRVVSLALSLLHLTLPGIPDVYQGDEVWNLSLVDPDNRRPVDWPQLRRLLAALPAEPDPEAVLAGMDDGLPKLWLLRRALATRRRLPAAFGPGGTYEPLAATGPGAERLFAFLRRGPGGEAALVAAPRLVLREAPPATLPLPAGRWRHELTGESFSGEVDRTALLDRFPVALLTRERAA